MHTADLDFYTVGLVYDMLAERSNDVDEYTAALKGTEADTEAEPDDDVRDATIEDIMAF